MDAVKSLITVKGSNLSMTNVKEINSFIDRFTKSGFRTEVVDCFSNGCCYWFAKILESRFYLDVAVIMYDQVENHFGCMINGRVYDITGDVTDDYNWDFWDKIFREDISLYHRIVRDCINF